jgi:hypothetical protein
MSRTSKRAGSKTAKAILLKRKAYREILDKRKNKGKGA